MLVSKVMICLWAAFGQDVSPRSDHSPLGINEAVSPSSLLSWRSSWKEENNNSAKYYIHRHKIFYLETVVGPGSKLHLAILVIEWEPGNIHRTRGHEDSWKYFFSITKLSLNTLSLLIHIIAKVAKYFSEIRFVWFNFSSLSPPVRWSMESNDCFVIWAATHLEECKSKSHPHWPPHLWDM